MWDLVWNTIKEGSWYIVLNSYAMHPSRSHRRWKVWSPWSAPRNLLVRLEPFLLKSIIRWHWNFFEKLSIWREFYCPSFQSSWNNKILTERLNLVLIATVWSTYSTLCFPEYWCLDRYSWQDVGLLAREGVVEDVSCYLSNTEL